MVLVGLYLKTQFYRFLRLQRKKAPFLPKKFVNSNFFLGFYILGGYSQNINTLGTLVFKEFSYGKKNLSGIIFIIIVRWERQRR
jgi:hypothetical protein